MEAFQERDQAPTDPHAIMDSAFGGLVRSALGKPGRDQSVRRSRARSAPSASLVHPPLLVGAPRGMPHQRWPGGAVASEARPMGHCASDDNGAPHRPAAQRDRRLLRGWSESGHPGDERLGRWGASLVAQPASASRRDGGSGQRVPTGAGTPCRGRGTIAPVGQVARHRQAARRLCGAAVVRDCGRDPGTAVRLLTTKVTRGPRPACRVAGSVAVGIDGRTCNVTGSAEARCAAPDHAWRLNGQATPHAETACARRARRGRPAPGLDGPSGRRADGSMFTRAAGFRAGRRFVSGGSAWPCSSRSTVPVCCQAGP